MCDFKGETLLSVVMATYNDAEGGSLRVAIDSILHQTYKMFEFIICDDGSTDKTCEILDEVAKQDKRIKIIKNKINHKAGYARNCAIHAANGKYIAIMDSDDISHPQRLAYQVKCLEENPEYGFVGCKGQYFHEKIYDEKECYRFLNKPQAEDLLFSLPFVHASCVFRREILDAVGGYDISTNRFRVEDYDLLLRIYEKGFCGLNIENVLYYIRRDPAQYKRRKYRFRFNEVSMKYHACRKLGYWPRGIGYVIKPLIVGLIPISLLKKIQKKYYGDKN